MGSPVWSQRLHVGRQEALRERARLPSGLELHGNHALLNLNPEPFVLGLPHPQRHEPRMLGTDKGFFLPVQVGKK